jgi:hypothetical protein
MEVISPRPNAGAFYDDAYLLHVVVKYILGLPPEFTRTVSGGKGISQTQTSPSSGISVTSRIQRLRLSEIFRLLI